MQFSFQPEAEIERVVCRFTDVDGTSPDIWQTCRG